MPPLVITATAVRRELSGNPLSRALKRLAVETGTDAEVDSIIEGIIAEAQSEVEQRIGLYLTRRRIRTTPVEPGAVRGVDYDETEDPYDFIKSDWQDSMGRIRTRKKPIYEVERVMIRYGQSTANRELRFPNEWVSVKRKEGEVHILPILGFSAEQTAALFMVPLLTLGNPGVPSVPNIVTLDYTAGILPADFNPETDNPYDANPDHDVRWLLKAVRYLAAAGVLTSLERVVLPFGGSISMDGLSQSVNQGMFQQYIERYKADALAPVQHAKKPRIGFFIQ